MGSSVADLLQEAALSASEAQADPDAVAAYARCVEARALATGRFAFRVARRPRAALGGSSSGNGTMLGAASPANASSGRHLLGVLRGRDGGEGDQGEGFWQGYTVSEAEPVDDGMDVSAAMDAIPLRCGGRCWGEGRAGASLTICAVLEYGRSLRLQCCCGV